MELNPFPAAASMLLVSVAALSFSMPAEAYGQAAQRGSRSDECRQGGVQ